MGRQVPVLLGPSLGRRQVWGLLVWGVLVWEFENQSETGKGG